MANVLFKRGLQRNLPANGSVQDGVFYLTTDTNRLYVGIGTSKKLLNQTVQIVSDISDLTALTTQWGADASSHINDFYYVQNSNILAVYTGSGDDAGWVQINPDHDTIIRSMSAVASTPANNVSTITIDAQDQNGSGLDRSAETGGIDGRATLSVEGAGSVHLSKSGNNLVFTGDTYEIGASVVADNSSSATINLTSDTAADSTSITLSSSDTAALDFSPATGGGGIVINAHNTTLSNGSVTVGVNNGTLSVAVADSDGTQISGQAERVGVELTGADGTSDGYLPLSAFVAGTSTGEVYSKDAIDSMMKGLDGMTYKGTIGTSGATVSSLPSSNVKNGDTYVVVESGLTASSTPFSGATFEANTEDEMSAGTKVGDMIIAKGTEVTDGYVTAATLEWTYIPAGNDSLDDVTYTATVDTSANSIKLANANGTGNKKMALVAGTDMAITSAVSTDSGANANSTLTSTINHATITTTPVTGSAVADEASFVAVTGLTVSNGHITGYTTQEYSPVTYDLEGATVTMTSSFNGTTNSGTNVANINNRLVDSAGNYSSNDSNFNIESSTIKLTAGTGANANKLTMDFEWGSF